MTVTATPPTIVHNDTPRTRRRDPLTSHQAGDLSQRSINSVKGHVLFVMAKADPNGLTGTEINDQYLFAAARLGWDRCAWDSPRKRAGELHDDGYLEVIGTRPATGRGTSSQESIYGLTALGRKIATMGRGRDMQLKVRGR